MHPWYDYPHHFTNITEKGARLADFDGFIETPPGNAQEFFGFGIYIAHRVRRIDITVKPFQARNIVSKPY
jgi:hypothetical protein